jgi:hypothetical protein
MGYLIYSFMKLYRYKNFIKESKEDIHSICKKYNIQNYTINQDGYIDVEGNVYISGKGLTELPLKFGKVGGNFYCDENRLTSLEGAPREVVGNFFCNNNKLTSLEGLPRSVGGYFYCYRNQLTSLEGISKYISAGIYCDNNKIRDVKVIKDGWRGEVGIEGNPVYEIFKLFPYKRWDELIEFLNEYEVIRDGKLVVLQALELVFYEMSLEVPEIDQIEGYQIQY